ncbi:MAG: ComF family protein [Bacillota bacterium]|nr:ComF family protein [Bacillota bacterium]
MIDFIFPSNIYCLVCGALIDSSRPYSLCDDCVQKIHWINGVRTCAKCGKALPETYLGELCYDCMRSDHYFQKGFSCMTYGLHEREMMMDLKYNGHSYVAGKMGDVMFDRMMPELEHLGIDIVIPVPVGRDRLRKRGYNQAELMARAFVHDWRKYCRSHEFPEAPQLGHKVLYRTRDTVMLRSLSPEERKLVMDGAFAVKPSEAAKIQGKNVLLIDDIYTTGATADSCSKELLQAGAAKVYNLNLASGGNRK